MRHWSDFLDVNILRPNAFERRRRTEQQLYQRPTSTASLPNNLSNGFFFNVSSASTPAPASGDPLTSLELGPRRLSLDSRRRASISNSRPSRPTALHFRTLSYQDVPPTFTYSSSSSSTFNVPTFTRGQFLSPPSTLTEMTLSRFRSSRSVERRGASLDIDQPHSSRTHLRLWRAVTGRSYLRGRPGSRRANSSTTTTTLASTYDSRRTGTGDEQEMDPELDEQEDQAQERHTFKFLPRPSSGVDMTPRTSRSRRPVESESNTDLTTHTHHRLSIENEQIDNSHAVVVVIPTALEISQTGEAVAPDTSPSSTTTTAATTQVSVTEPIAIVPSESSPTPSRTTSPNPNNSNNINNNPLVRLSTVDSSFTFQPPLTPAERRIQDLRDYLKKFICVIATLPVIATLAIYNRIELVMWWVIALPLIGITIAAIWRWKLGRELQRLQNQVLTSRFNPRNSSSRNPPNSHYDNDPETSTAEAPPPPPPDYQASIITPPAYILAQQPRKVPSYRSLENLFALARHGASIISRSGSAANTSDGGSTEHLPQSTVGVGSSGSQHVTIVIEQSPPSPPPEESTAKQQVQSIEASSSLANDTYYNISTTTIVSNSDAPTETNLVGTSALSSKDLPEMVEIRPAFVHVHRALEDDDVSELEAKYPESHYLYPDYCYDTAVASTSASTSTSACPSTKGEVVVNQEGLHSNVSEGENEIDTVRHGKQTLRDLKGKAPSR
ncbi:hypothetical protein BGX27_010816 [Mortierella sp. AM989]|nr:hypothetical protein BGX27_010816 [Mortierella sp. AM989]